MKRQEMVGRIVSWERLSNEIEHKICIEFIIPDSDCDAFMDVFKDNKTIIFRNPIGD